MSFTLKITKIEVQKKNKNKANIFVDNEYRFALHLETLLKKRIEVNTEITEYEIEKLVEEDSRVKALSETVNYVSKGLKNRKQIKTYLTKKEYSKQTIDFVIEKLEEYKLIDDETYIKAFINDHKQYGEVKLKQLLCEKGFSKQKLDEYFLDYEVDLDNIKKMKDKYMKNKENNYINNMKCKKYLLSHGFSYEDISNLDWSENEDWN